MKKIAFSLAIISLIGLQSCNNTDNKKETYQEIEENGTVKTETVDRNEQLLKEDELPESVRNFITQNFANAQIQNALHEKNNLEGDEYKVQLTDGTKIEFDQGGNWEEVKKEKETIGKLTFLPTPLTDYIKNNYPADGVEKVEKKAQGYEVDLYPSDVELKFDQNGNFVSKSK